MSGCGRKLGLYDCCTVVCGDCLELMKALPDGCVDAVITDPPYNFGFDYGEQVNDSRQDYREWLGSRMALVVAALAEGGQLYLHQPTRNLPDIMPLFPECKLLAWCKNFSQIWPSPWNWGAWEPVIYWSKGKPRTVNKMNASDQDRDWYVTRGALGLIKGVPQLSKHPCPKPPEAEVPLILRSTLAGDIILDPFLGSGTTAVAALKLGRHFLGFEISEEYCCIARERIALVKAQPNLFEKKAEQLDLGEA